MPLFRLFALAIALTAATTHAAEPKPANRAEATAVIHELRKIVTPNGIERNEMVRIGGIDQFVSIRGDDRRNPVILILHGGPGFPTTPIAWWSTHGLEEYFTIVHWDQRGSGKTYLANDPKAVAPTMKPERFIDDTEELVSWLRKELGKKKVFVLGTSWGSYVGIEFARRRPEWLHAYIGMGQITNTPESERRGYAYALDAARKAGNAKAIAELEAIAPYAAPGKPIPLKDIAIERKWSDHFGGVMAYRTRQIDGIAARLSPDYSDEDAGRVFEGNNYSQEFLFGPLVALDLSTITELDCPLLILAGRHDRSVNSTVAREWFDKVRAPRKKFVWFEHSAHEIMAEEPGKLLMTLVQEARPIAAKAGDSAGDAKMRVATGTFEVTMTPLGEPQATDGVTLGRFLNEKRFDGNLAATSRGEMLTAMTNTDNSASYVLIEQVTGTLQGRRGSFALQHSSTVDRGRQHQTIRVVPDSGTGELSGLTGEMTVQVSAGKHAYTFNYSLPK